MKSLQWLLSALSPLILTTTIATSASAQTGMLGNSATFEFAGAAVKGAPFSADVVHEFTQVLGDGNRIHREWQGKILRDADGRSRSEVADDGFGRAGTPRILINDPVSQTYVTLYPQTRTAIVNHMTGFRDGAGRGIGVGSSAGSEVVRDGTGREIGIGAFKEAQGKVQNTQRLTTMSSERLGKKEIEGFIASGSRYSRTIPAGEIGNEKLIVSTTETWFSEDLKTTLFNVIDDPQTGQRIARLTNIHSGDPDPQLFQIPPDYTVKDIPAREEVVVTPSTPN